MHLIRPRSIHSPRTPQINLLRFIGLSAAPFDKYLDSGPFKGAGSKFDPALLFNLGVRHYRMVLKYELTHEDAAANVKSAFEKYGMKPMFLISPGRDGSTSDVVQLLKSYGGNDVVSEVEFPNEVNNKFPPQELNLKYRASTTKKPARCTSKIITRPSRPIPQRNAFPQFVSPPFSPTTVWPSRAMRSTTKTCIRTRATTFLRRA